MTSQEAVISFLASVTSLNKEAPQAESDDRVGLEQAFSCSYTIGKHG